MALREIRETGDPVLNKVSKKVIPVHLKARRCIFTRELVNTK